jgi:hypothetical protein
VDLNRVLTDYFDHAVAASAQYRVARCLDALGRGPRRLIVSGRRQHLLAPEAPAGTGRRRRAAKPQGGAYFSLSSIATPCAGGNARLSRVPRAPELVEAAIALGGLSLGREPGQLVGAPDLLLARMPESRSPWRAHALLFDADALVALGRYACRADARSPVPRVLIIRWCCGQSACLGHACQTDSPAAATESDSSALRGDRRRTGSRAAYSIAHARFNQKEYGGGGLRGFHPPVPEHPERLRRLSGRVSHATRPRRRRYRSLEAIVAAPEAPTPSALARAGDLYFQAEHYTEAKRCYEGLNAHFSESTSASRGLLRIAQCEYNAGNDPEAIEGFARTAERYPIPGAREAARVPSAHSIASGRRRADAGPGRARVQVSDQRRRRRPVPDRLPGVRGTTVRRGGGVVPRRGEPVPATRRPIAPSTCLRSPMPRRRCRRCAGRLRAVHLVLPGERAPERGPLPARHAPLRRR